MNSTVGYNLIKSALRDLKRLKIWIGAQNGKTILSTNRAQKPQKFKNKWNHTSYAKMANITVQNPKPSSQKIGKCSYRPTW